MIQIQSEQEKLFSDLLFHIVQKISTVILILLYLPIGGAIASVMQLPIKSYYVINHVLIST